MSNNAYCNKCEIQLISDERGFHITGCDHHPVSKEDQNLFKTDFLEKILFINPSSSNDIIFLAKWARAMATFLFDKDFKKNLLLKMQQNKKETGNSFQKDKQDEHIKNSN